jgi:hypothetical protein
MTENTTFELHVQQGDQWTIHENYKGDQRKDAIEDAKDLLAQRPDLDGVKVIKETLDPDTGIFKAAIIFKASAPKKEKPRKVYRGTGQTGGANRGATAAPRTKTKSGKKERRKELINLKQFVIRLVLVLFFSAFIAALFAVGATELLGGTRTFGIRFVGRAETNLLATVFIIIFLVAASGLTIAVMRNVKLKKGKTGPAGLMDHGLAGEIPATRGGKACGEAGRGGLRQSPESRAHRCGCRPQRRDNGRSRKGAARRRTGGGRTARAARPRTGSASRRERRRLVADGRKAENIHGQFPGPVL